MLNSVQFTRLAWPKVCNYTADAQGRGPDPVPRASNRLATPVQKTFFNEGIHVNLTSNKC